MQTFPIAPSTLLLTCAAPEHLSAMRVQSDSRSEPQAPGETPSTRTVECQRGAYLPTLVWLRERQALLSGQGYRVRRTAFRSKGSRWVGRIVYSR